MKCLKKNCLYTSTQINIFSGVLIYVVTSVAEYCGFHAWSGQAIVYKIAICCFSAKHATLRNGSGWHGIRIMCFQIPMDSNVSIC